MKIIGIIPARYASTRFPGKPMADICGKPMLWWVYKHVKRIKKLEDVYIATDDERIKRMCVENNMKFIMTSSTHPDHIARVAEVSNKIDADYYICVNGDEPLMLGDDIEKVIPEIIVKDKVYVGYLMRYLTDPVETIDPANIKIVVNNENRIVYMSRSPIPYPKGTIEFAYRKLIGVECFNKKALDFFSSTKIGNIEKVEDIDPLRFIEGGHDVYASLIDSDSLSVDTKNDLERVRIIMNQRLKEGKEIIDEY